MTLCRSYLLRMDGNIADMLGPGDDPFLGVNTLMIKEIF